MHPQRPDLSQLAPTVRAYIEYLEAELEKARSDRRTSVPAENDSPQEPSEPPTTFNVVTISQAGVVKRTPRHLYVRQRRGGMGIFDLESGPGDAPAFLVVADESQRLLVLTDRSRLFFVKVADLPETPVRGKGQSLSRWLPLQPDEQVSALIPEESGTHLHMLSDRGWVRRLSGTMLANIRPGTILEVRQGHTPVAACWSSGTDDLFLATRQGKGIRFSERQVPIQGGCLGIRLEPGDVALAIVAVQEESGVFLLSDEGKGTVRLMSGFRANKAPGAGGKVALKSEQLVGAATVTMANQEAQEDILAISQLGKIIRFAAAEVPAKEGVVQGVNCMNLRSDTVAAFTSTMPPVGS